MKRVFIFVLAILLVFSSISPGFAMLRYLDQWQELQSILMHGTYDELLEKVKRLNEEHPLLMTNEWQEKIVNLINQAKNAFVPEYNSEYDPFENKTYYWFADHRKATAEDNCVIIIGNDGLVMSFYFPVEKWINTKEYTALINETDRVSGKVNNSVYSSENGQRYETFYIDFSDFKSDTLFNASSIAIRFYGKNRDDHFDFSLNEETIGYIHQVTTPSIGDEEIKELLWQWAESIDYATRILRNNNGVIFPENIEIKDYYTFQDDMRKDVVNVTDLGLIYRGRTFFFPCRIKETHDSDSFNIYAYWDVEILDDYGFKRTTGTIIVDNEFLKDGWIVNSPNNGDTVIIAATFVGTLPHYFRPVFILGYGEDITKIAKALGK